ncbi:hypothetical protein BU25DRAFT_468896 [Macroventuria anomochaeta]|uniref:Uncharacterized protein n=1 Tax=Macroventuria anomochaeta TaxID=301207 RepID=A0ACB6RZQ6_9PLEO|nr:uncharacterized protein BU25DRAFT_468896 [Macroventuria anomochaeta]KAF2627259.1 hypothetical protein BU25DRAFT_468896 [Macroventuria anomochaeta]
MELSAGWPFALGNCWYRILLFPPDGQARILETHHHWEPGRGGSHWHACRLSCKPLNIETAVIYVPCFVCPWLLTAFEYSFTQKAHIHMEDNGFIRLTIPLAFSSHPVTICLLPSVQAKGKSELVFYIRYSHGLTKLCDYAQKHPGTVVPVLIDGPYRGINMQRFNKADRLLVVAGGSGAVWILSFLELFCRQRSAIDAADGAFEKDFKTGDEERQTTRLEHCCNVRIVLATRYTSSRTWFLEIVAELIRQH